MTHKVTDIYTVGIHTNRATMMSRFLNIYTHMQILTEVAKLHLHSTRKYKVKSTTDARAEAVNMGGRAKLARKPHNKPQAATVN